MDRIEVKEKLVKIIEKQGLSDKIDLADEIDYVKDLKADSLDSVEIVMEIEDEFNITISDLDAKRLETIGLTVNYIIKKFEDKEIA